MKILYSYILVFLLLATDASAAVFHVSTTGTKESGASTADDWSNANCYANIEAAIGAMSAGDEVIVNNGTYALTSNNYINTAQTAPPSGNSIADPTVIKARNTLEVRIESTGDITYNDAFVVLSGVNYVTVDGFVYVCTDATPLMLFSIGGTYNKVSNCIGIRSGYADDYSYVFYVGGSYNLVEDCAAAGHTRYLFNTGGATSEACYNIFRRCVARTDYSDSNQPMAGFAHYGNNSGTGSNHMLYQNCIAIDGHQMATGEGTYAYAWGGFYFPKNAYQDTLYGCIVLNCDVRYGGFTPLEESGGELTMTNCVAYDNENSAASGVAEGLNLRGSGGGIYLSHLTLGGAEGLYNNNSGTSDSLADSLFWNNSSIGTVGTIATVTTNAFNPNTQAFGSSTVNAATASYLYLTRIEASSVMDGTATDDGDIGATILYKMGTTGAFYGETGYATLTNDSLWPWPNEDKIKEVFAETNNSCSGCTPETNDTTRGFTDTGKQLNGTSDVTLTSYIWEYLGNQMPSDIYGGNDGAIQGPGSRGLGFLN